ncbi:hypothetical protein DIPPA_15409 [Diplonema papillatum]|nr:hypothetical protein DIPPA_15409 [Diplonema papillatum]
MSQFLESQQTRASECEPPDHARRRTWAAAKVAVPAAAVFGVLCVACGVGAFLSSESTAAAERASQRRAQADLLAARVGAALRRAAADEAGVAALLSALRESVDNASFSHFAAQTAAPGQYPRGLHWIQRVAGTERSAFEARKRSELNDSSWTFRDADGGVRGPAGEYFVVYHAEPAAAGLVGLDVWLDPREADALRAAAAAGKTALRTRLLACDPSPPLPPSSGAPPAAQATAGEGPCESSSGRATVHAKTPVPSGAPAAAAAVYGFGAGSCRVDDLMAAAVDLPRLALLGWTVRVYADDVEAADPETVDVPRAPIFASVPYTSRGEATVAAWLAAGETAWAEVSVAGATWHVGVGHAGEDLDGALSPVGLALLASAVVLAVAISGGVVLGRGRLENERLLVAAAAARAVAGSIAEWDFDAVRGLLAADAAADPLLCALRGIVALLEQYRRFLPDPLRSREVRGSASSDTSTSPRTLSPRSSMGSAFHQRGQRGSAGQKQAQFADFGLQEGRSVLVEIQFSDFLSVDQYPPGHKSSIWSPGFTQGEQVRPAAGAGGKEHAKDAPAGRGAAVGGSTARQTRLLTSSEFTMIDAPPAHKDSKVSFFSREGDPWWPERPAAPLGRPARGEGSSRGGSESSGASAGRKSQPPRADGSGGGLAGKPGSFHKKSPRMDDLGNDLKSGAGMYRGKSPRGDFPFSARDAGFAGLAHEVDPEVALSADRPSPPLSATNSPVTPNIAVSPQPPPRGAPLPLNPNLIHPLAFTVPRASTATTPDSSDRALRPPSVRPCLKKRSSAVDAYPPDALSPDNSEAFLGDSPRNANSLGLQAFGGRPQAESPGAAAAAAAPTTTPDSDRALRPPSVRPCLKKRSSAVDANPPDALSPDNSEAFLGDSPRNANSLGLQAFGGRPQESPGAAAAAPTTTPDSDRALRPPSVRPCLKKRSSAVDANPPDALSPDNSEAFLGDSPRNANSLGLQAFGGRPPAESPGAAAAAAKTVSIANTSRDADSADDNQKAASGSAEGRKGKQASRSLSDSQDVSDVDLAAESVRTDVRRKSTVRSGKADNGNPLLGRQSAAGKAALAAERIERMHGILNRVVESAHLHSRAQGGTIFNVQPGFLQLAFPTASCDDALRFWDRVHGDLCAVCSLRCAMVAGKVLSGVAGGEEHRCFVVASPLLQLLHDTALLATTLQTEVLVNDYFAANASADFVFFDTFHPNRSLHVLAHLPAKLRNKDSESEGPAWMFSKAGIDPKNRLAALQAACDLMHRRQWPAAQRALVNLGDDLSSSFFNVVQHHLMRLACDPSSPLMFGILPTMQTEELW